MAKASENLMEFPSILEQWRWRYCIRVGRLSRHCVIILQAKVSFVASANCHMDLMFFGYTKRFALQQETWLSYTRRHYLAAPDHPVLDVNSTHARCMHLPIHPPLMFINAKGLVKPSSFKLASLAILFEILLSVPFIYLTNWRLQDGQG